MKNILIIVALAGFLWSCSNKEDAGLELDSNPGTELKGKWLLIEQLMGPGDCSGTFVPVTSDHVMEIFNDFSLLIINSEFFGNLS